MKVAVVDIPKAALDKLAQDAGPYCDGCMQSMFSAALSAGATGYDGIDHAKGKMIGCIAGWAAVMLRKEEGNPAARAILRRLLIGMADVIDSMEFKEVDLPVEQEPDPAKIHEAPTTRQ